MVLPIVRCSLTQSGPCPKWVNRDRNELVAGPAMSAMPQNTEVRSGYLPFVLSLRLLPQRQMRPSEIRGGRILADFDDAAADGAGAGKVLEQRFAVVAADRAGEF